MLETVMAAARDNAETIIILAVILMITAMVWLHHAQALAGRIQARRPLRAFDTLRLALGRGAETGKPIHLSPGAGTISDRSTTAETVVGLLAAGHVTAEAARNGAPVVVSSGDAVAHMALRGTMRQAYRNAGQTHDYDPRNVQLLAHQDPTAYVTGVMTLYASRELEASQLIGSFGEEFLLCGETGAQQGLPQVAGATSTAALPVMLLSTPQTLIGEEVFAAEAYLSDDLASQARLRTQDVLRNTVILLIIGGVIYAFLQPTLGLPPLPEL